MGAAIVQALLAQPAAAVAEVVVHDPAPAAVAALEAMLPPAGLARLRVAGSGREVAERAPVVCTMVPGPPEMRAAALGPEGVVAGLRPGSVYVDHTTTDPELVEEVGRAVTPGSHGGCLLPVAARSRETYAPMQVGRAVAARGAHFLDAPVMGDRQGIQRGVLTVLCGGDAVGWAAGGPVIARYASNALHMGPLGTGTARGSGEGQPQLYGG